MTFLEIYVTMVDENGHQTVKQPSDMQALESSKTRDRGPPKHCFLDLKRARFNEKCGLWT